MVIFCGFMVIFCSLIDYSPGYLSGWMLYTGYSICIVVDSCLGCFCAVSDTSYTDSSFNNFFPLPILRSISVTIELRFSGNLGIFSITGGVGILLRVGDKTSQKFFTFFVISISFKKSLSFSNKGGIITNSSSSSSSFPKALTFSSSEFS